MKPLVSINLCCYNSEKYLRETLNSIVAQTYDNWELVIINDGSADSTESIVFEFINQGYPIIYRYQQNRGLGYSRNEALKHSHGEIIAFIDHDDLWLPTKIEKQVPLFEDPRNGLVFSDAIYFNDSGRSFRLYRKRKVPEGNIFKELLMAYFLCISTVMVSRQALTSLREHFDERFRVVEEVDLFTRIAFAWNCKYVKEPLSKYRLHGRSTTWNNLELFASEYELLIDEFVSIYPKFEETFDKELSILRRTIAHNYSVAKLLKGNNREARRFVASYALKHSKSFLLYFLTLMPSVLFGTLFRHRKLLS